MMLPYPFNKLPWNQNIRNILIYFLSSGFARSIPFLFLPLLTRLLSPEDFGILGLATVFIALFSRLIAPGAPEYILARYHQYSSEEMSLRLSAISNFAIYVSIFLVSTVSVLQLAGRTGPVLPYWTFLCIIAIAYFTNILYIAQTLNQIETRITRYVSYELTNAFLIGIAVVVLVIIYGLKWEGRFFSLLVGYALVGVAALFYLVRSRSIVLTFTRKLLTEFLKFSLPYVPHSLGLWVLNSVGRLFLIRYVSLAEAGYFHVAMQLLVILMLAYDAVFKVWNPLFFRNIASADDNPRLRRRIAKHILTCLAGIAVLALIYLAVSQPVLRFLTHENFVRSADYLNWLTFGLIAYSVTRIFANFLYHAGKTNLLGISTLISGMLAIPLVFLMYRLAGPVGVAQAVFLAFTLHTLLIVFFAYRTYPLLWMLKGLKNTQEIAK